MPAAFVSFVKNAFQDRLVSPEDVTAQIQALAQKFVQDLSLENEVINDPFMARADSVVDGVPVDTIRQTLLELSQMKKATKWPIC